MWVRTWVRKGLHIFLPFTDDLFMHKHVCGRQTDVAKFQELLNRHHAPITIILDDYRRGPPRIWRLNSSLIADKEICQELIREHRSFFELNALPNTNTCMLWSTYKTYMRGILIKLNKRLKKERNRQIDEIMLQIKKLEKQNKTYPSHKLSSELLKLRQILRSLLLYKYENNLKYTKANHYALGNKLGALLARKVKVQHLKYKISPLLHPRSRQLLTDLQKHCKCL